jgi:hypothetical protein
MNRHDEGGEPPTGGSAGEHVVDAYERPSVTDLGTFLHLTQGNQQSTKNDGSASSKTI